MDMHLYFAAKAFLESLIYYLSHLGIEDKKAILVEEIKPALNQ